VQLGCCVSEQESYAANYETGFRSTIRLLLSRGLLIEDAEELAQAAWVRGWEAMHQLRSSGRVIPWINTIALNSMYNQQRRRRRHVARLDEDFSVQYKRRRQNRPVNAA
jgi:DNA-directed RNA polymerase specialized sigma24 family protein